MTVDFMVMVEWFLVTHFQWSITPAPVKVHLSQKGFTSHLIEENNINHYRSGLPIDACPKSDKDKEPPTFLERERKYQSVAVSIG
jgi:hypothetical protein